jgi:hypothetical protein
MKSWWLPFIAFIGLALLGVGIYSVTRTSDPSPISVKPSSGSTTQLLKEGDIPVTQQWTPVGKYKGKIIVSVSGQAKLDHTIPPLSPDGEAKIAPSFFTLPGEPIFCALAKYGDKVERIGAYKEIFLESETELFLGPNEDVGKHDGAGLDDNSGFWSYKILTPNPPAASRKEIDVPASAMWFDTGIDTTGRVVRIQYMSGRWTNGGEKPIYADCMGSGSYPGLIVPGAPFRSLVGKTENGSFFVGGDHEIKDGRGHLLLSINDQEGKFDDNQGSLTVSVSVN